MSDAEPVLFYGPTSNEHGVFSNFYHALFWLDGKQWPSSEHYYMAQKTLHEDEREAIRRAPTPGKAKRMGREVQLRPGWDEIKYGIMRKAVYAKFDQNAHLRLRLLATGDLPLHENCKDPWWGGGPNFPNGRDWLGKILVEVRAEMLAKYGPPPDDGETIRAIVAGLE